MSWTEVLYSVGPYVGYAAAGIFIAEAIVLATQWVRNTRDALPSVGSLAASIAELRHRVYVLEKLEELRHDRRESAAEGIGESEREAEPSPPES
jgi:hypothetical protein